MVCRIEGNKRYKHFTYFRHFTVCVIFHICLLQQSHGVHLSKTISFTALDLAKSAGMDEEDISAAAIFDGNGSEEGEVEGGELRGVGSERKVHLEDNPLVDNVETPLDPVLPLCCSTETDDDVEYIQCGGDGVISSNENVNNGGFQTRTWTAPYKLVSTKFPAEFRLEKSVLNCESATFSASISLNENSTEGNFFYPDGTLKFANEFYGIREFCLRSIRKDKITLQICQANCSNPLTPCIQKCCGLDEIYSFGSDDYATGCQPVSEDGGSSSAATRDIKWSPILYHNLSAKLTRKEVSRLRPHYIQKYPSSFKHKCKSQKTTVFPFGMAVANYLTLVTGKPFKNLEFRLRKDGWLLYPFRDLRGNEIPVINRLQNYCIDGAHHYGETNPYSNQESEMESVLFLCSGGVQEAFENSIIAPDSDEVTVNVPPTATTTSNTSSSHAENNAHASGEAATANIASSSALSQLSSNNNLSDVVAESFFDQAKNGSGGSNDPSSAEIYLNTKARPHILYQLFQLTSQTSDHF